MGGFIKYASHEPSHPSDFCHNWPSRASSCQLPLLQPGLGMGVHRSSQSCQLDPQLPHPSPGLPPRCPSSASEYHGSKSEKPKAVLGLSPYSLAAILTVFLFSLPAAFYAGHASAAWPSSCQRNFQTSLIVGKQSSGGNGRQLFHDADGEKVLELEASEDYDTWIEVLNQPAFNSTSLVPHEQQPKATLLDEDILFVTWIAFGEYGDGGLKSHNFHKVDMRWAEVVRKSHPGCKIGVALDQDTQLEDPSSIDFLHRISINKAVYGRNEYNDYYHWTARYSFLEKLRDEGHDNYNVVFLDPDVFVLDDIHEVFQHGGFDYATTISEGEMQPVNGAMHFVRARHYTGAIDVLKGVLALFQLKPEMGFTAGQQAYSDFFELTMETERVLELQSSAIEQGVGCHSIQGGGHNICYFICTRYNYWEGCTNHSGAAVTPDKVDDYVAAHVKVFHFIAYRKLGMQRVYDAYMTAGLEAAYTAWAALPHTEEGYDSDPSFGEEA